MAKYNSIVNISGAIGDLVFYNLNGTQVVRKKSGFNTADFKTKESYKKVRENSTEFGHCSKAGKMLREALTEYISNSGDKYLYQKFAKVMTEIKNLDKTSEPGKRRIENGLLQPEGRSLLKQFKFGNIGNALAVEHSENLMDHSVIFNGSLPKGEIIFITLYPDFGIYHCKISEQKTASTGQKKFIFEKQSSETASTLLYFLAVKDGEDIKMAGFL